nr:cadherin-23-like [Mirounga angustirostris]
MLVSREENHCVVSPAPLSSLSPTTPLPLSIPSWLALAPSPHCTPFPLCLLGWWCRVPGVVTVRFGVIIDREAFSPPVLELLLLAEDIGLLNGTADLLVTVLDDNDNWPTFSPPTLTVHLLENCPPGFSVLQVTATDKDSGLNGELIYRIEAGAQDRFLIHPVTGVIRVANVTIDREEQESYRLTVVATDRGTIPLSGTAIITILIDDINDSRPEFLNPIQTVSVLESAEPGTVIANVTAVDRDLNPKLEYHIIGIVAKDDTDRLVPDQEDAFAVNINTGS